MTALQVILTAIIACLTVSSLLGVYIGFIAQMMYYKGWHEARAYPDLAGPTDARTMNLLPLVLFVIHWWDAHKDNWHYALHTWKYGRYSLLRLKAILAMFLNHWRDRRVEDVLLAEIDGQRVMIEPREVRAYNGPDGFLTVWLIPVEVVIWKEITTSSSIFDLSVAISEKRERYDPMV